jgi:capsular exopolysaccharide synthesis family protein
MPTDHNHPAELSPVRPPALIVPPNPASAPGESDEGAGASSGLSPTKLLHALRRTWLIAVPLAAAVAVGVYLFAETRVTPVYTARTLLHVAATRPTLLYELPGRMESANPQRTQIATVKSRFVLQAAVRDLAPLNLPLLAAHADPAAWLEKEIQADYTVAPEIMRITLKGADSDQLLVILTAVREAYLREVLNKDQTERVSRLRQLTELAAKHDATLKALRQKLVSRAEALGARDLVALRVKYEHLTGQIHALNGELLAYRAWIMRAELVAAPGDAAAPDAAAVEGALAQAVADDPVSERFRQTAARAEKKLADYKLTLRNYETDPVCKRLADELAAAREALKGRREELRAAADEQARATARAQMARDAAVAERLIAAAKQSVPQLEAEIQRREQEAAELAKGLAELELLRADVASQEEQVKLVNSRIQAQETELQAPPRARVIEDSAIVETPRWDRSVKFVGAPAAGAFVAVLLLVAWVDLRRGRVNGADDLEAGRIRVIGAVPAVRGRVLSAFSPPEQSSARREYDRLTDAVDMARAVIAPVLAAGPGYTLAVASAAAGEGKTVLAGHLAVRFARSGRKTLLIDTDVRRPRAHRLFGLRVGPGFGEWVCGRAGLAEVTAAGPAPGLHVIPAGGCDPYAVAELLDRRLPELLAAVKDQYDVVVLDTAPLLSTPESLVLARAADGVVLSVMRDVSRVAGVLTGYDRLLSVNARVLGAIVTGESAARYARY